MAQDYEDIVRKWYVKLRPEFLRRLTLKYSGLTLGDAENLYQDAFLAVYENLKNGRIKENTSWHSYIITIGMNKANKEWRTSGKIDSTDEGFEDEETGKTSLQYKIEETLKTLPYGEDDLPLFRKPEVQEALGEEIEHTPQPCKQIITLYYKENCSMEEIAEEIGFKNSDSVKSKKNQCMKDFIVRITKALREAGFNLTPKKKKTNGKN